MMQIKADYLFFEMTKPNRDLILQGKKTQTRRPVKKPININCEYFYGLREPIENQDGYAHYSDDGKYVYWPTGGKVVWQWKLSKLSQRYMRKAFARNFVSVVCSWTENLLEISQADAERECCYNPQDYFMLWDSIYGVGKHKENPLVQVIEFKLFQGGL